MNAVSLFFIIITSAILLMNRNSSCMKHNAPIGHIDMLMIANSLLQQGYDTIEQDVTNHEFIIRQWTITKPIKCITMYNPYRIVHYCSEDDNSALSDQVFDRINQINNKQLTLNIKNQFNQHPKAIDEHSLWKPIKNSPVIKVTAFFYDKKKLLKTLKTLLTLFNEL